MFGKDWAQISGDVFVFWTSKQDTNTAVAINRLPLYGVAGCPSLFEYKRQHQIRVFQNLSIRPFRVAR